MVRCEGRTIADVKFSSRVLSNYYVFLVSEGLKWTQRYLSRIAGLK